MESSLWCLLTTLVFLIVSNDTNATSKCSRTWTNKHSEDFRFISIRNETKQFYQKGRIEIFLSMHVQYRKLVGGGVDGLTHLTSEHSVSVRRATSWFFTWRSYHRRCHPTIANTASVTCARGDMGCTTEYFGHFILQCF